MAAFEGFDIDLVAKYNDEDVERLMADAGIVRNKKKILSTITNAQEIQGIVKEHGSVEAYLKSLAPSGEEAASRS